MQDELLKRATTYIDARRAQELDHTDRALNDARTEVHDDFMMYLDIVGIAYEDREDAARIAEAVAGGKFEIEPPTRYQLRKDWRDILNDIKNAGEAGDHLYNLLVVAKISDLDGTKLNIEFGYQFHAGKVTEDNKNINLIKRILKERYGIDFDITISVNGTKTDVYEEADWMQMPDVKPVMIHRQEPESPIEEMFFDALSVDRFITPQYKIGKYRVDFAIEYMRIAIELDGHDYHSSKDQRERDAKRERELQAMGWTVIRFTGTEIWHDVDSCIDQLFEIIKQTR